MLELPASVRVALWVTDAWGRGAPTTDALARALPDVDHVDGDVARLDLWHELGEGAVLVSLPGAGDLHALPRAGAEAVNAAVLAGECLVAPALGGLLVPTIETFGVGEGADSGVRLDFRAHDAEPVARHRVEALDGGTLERELRENLIDATEALMSVGGQPFGSGARDLADAVLGGDWRLPDDLPGRAHRALRLAASVSLITSTALDQREDGLDASTVSRRHDLLRSLHRVAEHTLVDATNACVAALAGWVPSMR